MALSHAQLLERYMQQRRPGKSCSMLADARAMYSFGYHWTICVRMDTKLKATLSPEYSKTEWYLLNDKSATSTTNSHTSIVSHHIHQNKKHACRVDFDHLETLVGRELIHDHEYLAKNIVLADETESSWGDFKVPESYTLYDWDLHHLQHEDLYSTVRLRHHVVPSGYWDDKSVYERMMPSNYVGTLVEKISVALRRIQTESDIQNPIIYDKYGCPKIIDSNVPGRVLLLQLNERTRRPTKAFLFQKGNWRQGGPLSWELKHVCKTVREAMIDLKPRELRDLEQKLGRGSYRILGYYLLQIDDPPIRKKDFVRGGFWITDTPQSEKECRGRHRGLVSSWGALVNGQVYGSGAVWPRGRQSDWRMPVVHMGRAGEVFYQVFPSNAIREIY